MNTHTILNVKTDKKLKAEAKKSNQKQVPRDVGVQPLGRTAFTLY